MVDKKVNITDKVSIATSFYKAIKSFGPDFIRNVISTRG